MTSERLNDLIEHCFRLHRLDNREAHYRNIARFLGVEPITLRRWLTGASPVPPPQICGFAGQPVRPLTVKGGVLVRCLTVNIRFREGENVKPKLAYC